MIDKKLGIDVALRFEDGSIHSLPQDYADVLGWEELTSVANKAYQMIGDKNASFIYCENCGQDGVITIIGNLLLILLDFLHLPRPKRVRRTESRFIGTSSAQPKSITPFRVGTNN